MHHWPRFPRSKAFLPKSRCLLEDQRPDDIPGLEFIAWDHLEEFLHALILALQRNDYLDKYLSSMIHLFKRSWQVLENFWPLIFFSWRNHAENWGGEKLSSYCCDCVYRSNFLLSSPQWWWSWWLWWWWWWCQLWDCKLPTNSKVFIVTSSSLRRCGSFRNSKEETHIRDVIEWWALTIQAKKTGSIQNQDRGIISVNFRTLFFFFFFLCRVVLAMTFFNRIEKCVEKTLCLAENFVRWRWIYAIFGHMMHLQSRNSKKQDRKWQ